jgi:hypothetical protein
MVYYSEQADNDLDDILEGLLSWRRYALTREFCHNYISDIIDVCNGLDTKVYHTNAVYNIHKRYGAKVYKYSRNKNTVWYIIYNIDAFNNIFVNKIMNNYLTIV